MRSSYFNLLRFQDKSFDHLDLKLKVVTPVLEGGRREVSRNFDHLFNVPLKLF